ncbi:hypothetical protein Tco_1211061 [Tanacetum coccineum]
MCMFALTVSTAEPKNIKEAMADSAWIKAMQDELHQFDRLQVWQLVDKPFGKSVIKLKWLWKNKKDEDQTVFAILSLDHFVEIPSGESKVHIEVLSVLWGNRLPIPDGSLPLSSLVWEILVTNIAQKDKNEAKWTKSSTGIE